jgi:hypothetical protein
MEGPVERRRYKRFTLSAHDSRLSIIREQSGLLEHQPCALMNLGYGGMCFRSSEPVRVGEQLRFRLELLSPPLGATFLKAEIRWARRFSAEEHSAGAEFLASSRAWLGPEEHPEDDDSDDRLLP